MRRGIRAGIRFEWVLKLIFIGILIRVLNNDRVTGLVTVYVCLVWACAPVSVIRREEAS